MIWLLHNLKKFAFHFLLFNNAKITLIFFYHRQVLTKKLYIFTHLNISVYFTRTQILQGTGITKGSNQKYNITVTKYVIFDLFCLL